MSRRRTPIPPAPLPQREGVDPVRVRLPARGPWVTVRDHLAERLVAAGPGAVDGMFAARRIVDVEGRPVAPDTPYAPGMYVWFHRELPPEVPVPYALDVVYRDEHLVVADKPHFLATTPRGGHVAETALTRLRRELDLPTLTAAHRLDRLTAGLVLFTVRPPERGAYQTLFRDRLIRKEYEAVAPYAPGLDLPRTVRSRLVKERGELTSRETDGEPNAVSRVELLDHRPAAALPGRDGRPAGAARGLARYRLLPSTGQTHQLRVHMTALGIPILGDPLYPVVTAPVPAGDFRRPLQLLARALEFTDPVTGRAHRLRSTRTLAAWTSYADWDDGQ